MGLFGKKHLSTHPAPPAPYHTLPVNQVVEHIKTDVDDGLTTQEATQRLELYGFNELSGQGNVSALAVLFRQIANALMFILVIALIISFVFEDYIEGGSFPIVELKIYYIYIIYLYLIYICFFLIGFIAIVIVTNTIIGFTQEYRAEKTMESLRKMASPTTRVIRGDSLISVPTRDIVVVSYFMLILTADHPDHLHAVCDTIVR
jgi:P-type Na+/K+ transporter